tara:strand:+ start:451 stop:651 length:201 start_codon:yes stop_codon:yes gene_type:complete
MAVTVELELTDAQWALVLEHYRNSVGDDLVTTTEEFASVIIKEVERNIIKQIDRKARQNNQNAFNV